MAGCPSTQVLHSDRCKLSVVCWHAARWGSCHFTSYLALQLTYRFVCLRTCCTACGLRRFVRGQPGQTRAVACDGGTEVPFHQTSRGHVQEVRLPRHTCTRIHIPYTSIANRAGQGSVALTPTPALPLLSQVRGLMIRATVLAQGERTRTIDMPCGCCRPSAPPC